MIIVNFLESLSWWYCGRTQTFKWYPQFTSVQTWIQNCEHTSRQSSNQMDKNVWKVCQVTCEERHRTINNWCNILGLSYSACQCTSINIWTWDKLLQNLCPVSWKMTRNKTDFLCQRTCKIRPKMAETSIYGLSVPKNENSKILQRFKLTAVVLDSIMEWEYQLCLQQWEKC